MALAEVKDSGESCTRCPDETSWLQLLIVAAAEFVMWTGVGTIIPFLPIYLREEGHSSVFMIGLVAGAFFLGTLLFSSLLGWVSDIIGRKPVMVAGMALFATASFLFTRTVDPRWFIFFRLLEGTGAASGGVMYAFVADLSGPGDRSKAFGLLTSAQFGGTIAGPALGAFIYHLAGGGRAGFHAIFYFGAAIGMIITIVMMLLIREPSATERRKAARIESPGRRLSFRLLLTPAIIAFLMVSLAGHLALGGMEVVWSIWLRKLGASINLISLTWVAFGVPMLLSFAAGALADRYSRYLQMIAGLAVNAVGFVVLGLITDLAIIVIISGIQGLALAFAMPAKQAFLIQMSPPKWIGTVMGMDATAMQIGALIGTLVSPALYDMMTGAVMSVFGVIGIIGLLIAAPVLNRERRRNK